jgi:molybdopterin-guanine dinucleotide biosynthesis protein A
VTLLGAILTGGASRRMNGQPKGLLLGVDGVPLAARGAGLLQGLGLPCVLVGHRALYGALGIPVIDDLRPGEGPLAGLEAALLEARAQGCSGALLLACDLPYLTAPLVERLKSAPPGHIAAPSRAGRYEPLSARYSIEVLGEVQARLDRGERAMQAFLRAVGVVDVPLPPEEEALLDDWDTPEQAGILSPLSVKFVLESEHVQRGHLGGKRVQPQHRQGAVPHGPGA